MSCFSSHVLIFVALIHLSFSLILPRVTITSTNNMTINATNPSSLPPLNVHLNMSGNGTFKAHVPMNGKETVVTYTSQWMQDDGKGRLYVSFGDAAFGDQLCLGQYWFFNNMHYAMTFENSNCSQMNCSCITGYGYNEEMDHYNSTYLAYMGRSYSYKFQKEMDSWAGRALDGVGPLSCIVYAGVNPVVYLGMAVIDSQNVTGVSPYLPFYSEYFYDDITVNAPDDKYFVVPQMCLDYQKNHNCTQYNFDQNGNVINNAVKRAMI